MSSSFALFLFCIGNCHGLAFNNPLFVDKTTVKTPAKKGVELELPDFDELFGRIEKVSPLSRLVRSKTIESSPKDRGTGWGFLNIDDESPIGMKWRTVEYNSKNVVNEIQKIENFQNLRCPLLRFRSSMRGKKVGELFSSFVMDLNHRKQYDSSIVNLKELYPAQDLQYIQDFIMGGTEKVGECVRLGVGYTETRANLVASAREQLTMCGEQKFPLTGGVLIWGTELEDCHNYLFPGGKLEHTRARSHLFSVALLPTGENTWDVEYILQLDTGGQIPSFLTTPVVISTIKSCFKYVDNYFQNEIIEYSNECA